MSNEPARQFNEIFKKHHDPVSKEKRRIVKNREKRKEEIKKDLGL